MTGLELALAIVVVILIALLFASIVALVITAVFALRYGTMARQWEDNIDDSLDMLDESYRSLTQTLQTPLFVDSPEVRKVLADIAHAREAVLLVADALQAPARTSRLRDAVEFEA